MDADSARRSDNALQNPAPTTQSAWFLGLAAGLLALAAAMFGALEVHQSGDTWISLAAGRQIAELGHVPTTDSFSYTFDGQPWINQNWLSHLLMWHGYETSPAALVYIHWARLTVTFALVLLAVRVRSQSWIAAAIATAVVAVGCRNFLSIRDAAVALFCLAALALMLQLIDAYRRARWPAIIGCGLVLVFWSMVHGSFVFGYAVVAAFVLCAFMQRAWTSDPTRPRPIALIGLAVVALAAAGATIVFGPFGIENFTHPGVVGESRLWRIISEWRSPFMTVNAGTHSVLRFWIIVGSLPVLFLLSAFVPRESGTRRGPGVQSHAARVNLFDIVVLCGALALSLWARRFAPFFYILGAAPLAGWLSVRLRPGAPELRQRFRSGLAIGCLAGAAALLWVNVNWIQEQLIDPFKSRPEFNLLERFTRLDAAPTEAFRFLNENKLGVRLFTEWEMAGPAMFFVPKAKVFIDGRAQQVYDQKHFERFMQLDSARDPNTIRATLDDFRTEAVLLRKLPENGAIYNAVNGSATWSAVCGDNDYALFLRMDGDALRSLVDRLREGKAWFPETGWGWVSRGWVYKTLGPEGLESAVDAWKKGVSLDPLAGIAAWPEIMIGMATLGHPDQLREYFAGQIRAVRSPEYLLPEEQRQMLVKFIQDLSRLPGSQPAKAADNRPGPRPNAPRTPRENPPAGPPAPKP